MVMACIHIICGNCGNGDKSLMRFENHSDIEEDENGEPETIVSNPSITCKNCSTMHFLDGQFGGEV